MSEIDRIRKAFEVGSPFAYGMALHELQVQSDAIAKRDARIADLERAMEDIAAICDSRPSNIHEEQVQRYSRKAVSIAQNILVGKAGAA